MVPIRLGTLLGCKPICVRCSQDGESFSIHPHAPPTNLPRPMMHNKVRSPKYVCWAVSPAAPSCLDLFSFFSPSVLLKCYFFHLYATTSRPSQTGLLEKMFILLLPWRNLISDKCILDADSIFLGHIFEILVDLKLQICHAIPANLEFGFLTSCLCPLGLNSSYWRGFFFPAIS